MISNLFSVVCEQVDISSSLLEAFAFQDEEQAREFLEENIGVFMACLAAAHNADIDMIEIIRRHHQVVVEKYKQDEEAKDQSG